MGVQRLTDKWHQREGDAKEKRRLKRGEGGGQSRGTGESTAVTEGLKKKRADGWENRKEKQRVPKRWGEAPLIAECCGCKSSKAEARRAREKTPKQRPPVVHVLDGC